ncbi:hypothetical protein CALCODRAFT_484546 [Calocera cornea HHB12733]|uniref:Uncharacterized protein n=1 Tax=Calocera cornea HHB12733 TaxID=1353952 RepID=A0A165EWF2_9BASI|nr:hypothetical protein CALCODRAFT_484546 [Calocera cornea HHB12733]
MTPHLGTATVGFANLKRPFAYNAKVTADLMRTSTPNATIMDAMLALLPQIIHLSQNTEGNVVADYIMDDMALDVTRYENIWESFLQGWVEYIASSVRAAYDPTIERKNDHSNWGNAGELTGLLYGWNVTGLHILFLVPILLVTSITVGLLLWALIGLRTNTLDKHDPTDAVTLLLAGATCDEELRAELEEARARGDPVLEDRKVRDIRVIFQDGQLVRVRK